MARSYSLVNDETEKDRYVIAVKRENGGRGGSLSMHTETAPGDILRISAPINSFGFVQAPKYLLIAGGIGITPIISVFRKLLRIGHPDFRLIYSTRSAETSPYLKELTAPKARDFTTIHHTSLRDGTRVDLWPTLKVPDERHIYYCGPTSLMNAIYAQTIHWPRSAIHSEDFAGVSATGADSRPFKVKKLATGEVFDIPADRSIVDVFRDAGLKPKSSCVERNSRDVEFVSLPACRTTATWSSAKTNGNHSSCPAFRERSARNLRSTFDAVAKACPSLLSSSCQYRPAARRRHEAGRNGIHHSTGDRLKARQPLAAARAGPEKQWVGCRTIAIRASKSSGRDEDDE